MVDLVLRNATIDRIGQVDVAVDGGAIIDRRPGLEYEARHEIDLQGRLLIPGFIESHVHLDIALMNSWDRPGRAEPFTSVAGLNEAMERRRRDFTAEDIRRRASMALELASRHGVTAMRAQCHVDPEVRLCHLEALLEIKSKYQDRIDLQIVAFPQQGILRDPGGRDLFRQAFRTGADVMGCASDLDRNERGEVNFRKHIDAAFDLAMEMDVDLDMHADLGIPPLIELNGLEVVYAARRAIECGYQGRVTAGHVCALGSATPDVAQQAIELIHAARMSVVSQPDLYRLGRDDTQHVRRGLTRVKQLLAAGVNVTYASNNVRDAYRPMGNFDLLEEGLILCYGAHMDTIEELDTILRMSTANAARALKIEKYGLEVGCNADMVVLDAPSPSAALIGQVEKTHVFKNGRLVSSKIVYS